MSIVSDKPISSHLYVVMFQFHWTTPQSNHTVYYYNVHCSRPSHPEAKEVLLIQDATVDED